jgi:histidinol phosphatase-like PHP family hydrolase
MVERIEGNIDSRKSIYTRRDFIKLTSTLIAALSTTGLAVPFDPEMNSILQDWHMHTNQAGGKPDAIVADIIKTNDKYGLKLMGISEHIDRVDQRTEFKEFIKANRSEADAVDTKMKVMIGTESTMINPNLCAVGDEIPALLDYVMVSCNHYHLKHVENPNPGTPQAYADHYLDMLMGATELGYADTIGHPFYHAKLRKKFSHEELLKILSLYNEERLTQVLKKSAQVNMAFEINPRHADSALEWFRDLVQEARLHGTKFTLGTDAHAIGSLGYPDGKGNRTCLDILNDLTLSEKDLKWKPINGFRITD